MVVFLFFSICVFVVVRPRHRDTSPGERVVLTFVGVPFLGLALIHQVRRLIWRQPDLIVTDEGIFDNQGVLPVGFIAWDEIEDVYPTKALYDIPVVRVVLRDPAGFLARRPYFRRFGRRLLWKRKRIDISVAGLPISHEELFSQMSDYMPERVRNA